jgi:hypothetical protein
MASRASIEKLKSKINKIKTSIDKHGKVLYFLIDDKGDSKLVSKGDSKSEVKSDFLSKINSKGYLVGLSVYQVIIKINKAFISKIDPLIPSPVTLNIKEFVINTKYKLVHKAGFKVGVVWYFRKDLEKGRFQYNDIKKIIQGLHDSNVDIIALAHINALELIQ